MSEITLVVKSEYDDVVAVITNGTRSGEVLSLSYEEQRRGGPVSAIFYLKEGSNVPLYTGMNIVIQKDSVPIAGFDVDGNPNNRGADGTIEVNCIGVCERLKKVYITQTLSDVSLKAACLTLIAKAASVGITIDESLIQLPTDQFISSLELEDETLYDFIETLVTYANGTELTDGFTWTIDTDKRLVIYDTDTLPEHTMYEGYGFQSPTSEANHSAQINTINMWRKALDGSDEYVGVFVDDASVDQYGIFEKKIELDYYASTEDCALIASGIFARTARPARTISVTSLLDRVTLGTYRLFLRPKLCWMRLYAGEDKDTLDLTHSGGVAYTDDQTSLIGKLSTKCTLGAVVSGYASLAIDPPILVPKRVRFFLKGTAGATMSILLVDKDGDTAPISFTLDGKWMQLSLVFDDTERSSFALYLVSAIRKHDIAETDAPYLLSAEEDPEDLEPLAEIFADGTEAGVLDETSTGLFPYALTLNDGANARTLYLISRSSIASLAEIRFYWTYPSCEIWLDYVDCQVKQWQMERIRANRVTYALKNDTLVASAEFGDESKTATDELTDLWSVIRSGNR